MVYGIFEGFHRGFLSELIMLISYFASFIVAFLFGDQISRFFIELFSFHSTLSVTLTHLIVFGILFSITDRIINLIGGIFRPIFELPLIRQLNQILGGVAGFASKYILILIVLLIFSVIPDNQIQSSIQQSNVAVSMLNKTPYLSEKIQEFSNSIGSEVK